MRTKWLAKYVLLPVWIIYLRTKKVSLVKMVLFALAATSFELVGDRSVGVQLSNRSEQRSLLSFLEN